MSREDKETVKSVQNRLSLRVGLRSGDPVEQEKWRGHVKSATMLLKGEGERKRLGIPLLGEV